MDSNQELGNQQLMFWSKFVEYCEQEDRAEDMATRKPYAQNWYDIPVIDADFQQIKAGRLKSQGHCEVFPGSGRSRRPHGKEGLDRGRRCL